MDSRSMVAEYCGFQIQVRTTRQGARWVWRYRVDQGTEMRDRRADGSATPEQALGAGLRAACAGIDGEGRPIESRA
jgi:hypothetical protein